MNKTFGRILSLTLAILLILGMLTGIVLPVSAAPNGSKITNVKVAGDNVQEYAGDFGPQYLLDGITADKNNQFWHSNSGVDNGYITFDLGDDVNVTELLVYPRNIAYYRNIKDYELFISDTAPTYTSDGTAPTGCGALVTAATLPQCTSAAPVGTIALPAGAHGRYLTLHILSGHSTSAAANDRVLNINEIEIYGSPRGVIEQKIGGVKYVNDNVAEYGNNPPANLLDGNLSNFWHSAANANAAYITFDLGTSKSLSKLLVYARTGNADIPKRSIKEYDIWVSDTAPTYSGTAVPAGLADTPDLKGKAPQCTQTNRTAAIYFPENVTGRYVTIYIKNTWLDCININEIEFFEAIVDVADIAASITGLQVDYENCRLLLPTLDGFGLSIVSSSNEKLIDLNGNVNTVIGGTANIVLKLTDENGHSANTAPISVFVIGLKQKMAESEPIAAVTASSEHSSLPAVFMVSGYANTSFYGRWWSSASNVKENEIVATLKGERNVVGVSILPADSAATFPKSIEVLVSSDQQIWTSVAKEDGILLDGVSEPYKIYFEEQSDVKYIKLRTGTDQQYTQICKIEALIAPEFETAAEAAEKLCIVQKDTSVSFDDITEQFDVEIVASSNEGIVAKDGGILLPDALTSVELTLSVTNRLDETDTATVTRTLGVKTQAMLDVEALAVKTNLIPCPENDATELTLPAVPDGYSIEIVESDHPGLVDLAGNITRSDTTTQGVYLTFKITDDKTGDSALTKPLLVPIYKTFVAPTMTQEEIDKIHQDYESKKYGIFVHYIAEGAGVTGTLYRDGRAVETPNELANAFDVEQFAKDMHDFGAEYVVLTVTHIGDAPLYPSMTSKRWKDDRNSQSDIVASYVERDVLRELIDALKPYNIDLHLYTRFDGENHYLYDEDRVNAGGEYTMQYVKELHYELCERYGTDLKGLWYDGMAKPTQPGIQQDEMKKLLCTFNPAMITAINTGFNDGQYNLYSHYNFQDASAWEINKFVDYDQALPFTRHQVATCLAAQYWWTRLPQNVETQKQPIEEMFRYLVALASISYEGGLLGSTGCYAIEPEDHGKGNDIWTNGMRDYLVSMNTNYMAPVAESVKNTSVGVAYPTTEGLTVKDLEWGVSTESRDGKNVYFHVLHPQADNTLTLPKPADGSLFAETAEILNFDGTATEGVTVTETESGYTLTLPEGKTWDSVDTVIKVERVGFDESIPAYEGDEVFYDQVLEGVADGARILRKVDGKEYYFTVGVNVSGTLTDDCYPVVDGVTQVHFFAKEYQPFHIYFGSYALHGAKAGINPNDEADITKPNALRASDEGETVLVGVNNAAPKGLTFIDSDGKVTFDGFTFKGSAQLQLGTGSTEADAADTVALDLINCRNSTAEDAYKLAPSTALVYGYTAEHKIVNIKNNRFDGVCFNGTSATTLIMIRNWEGVVEGNFISMKDSVTIGNGNAASATVPVFWLQGETMNGKDWDGRQDVTIRGNYLEGRVSTTVAPMWYDEYKVHILDNTIVPTDDSKSLINITAAGGATVGGTVKYYSNIDTADILIKGNKVVDLYDHTGVGLLYFGGTVTAAAAEQVADINDYQAGSIKVIQNEFAHVGSYAFGGSDGGLTGYENLVIDIACNTYADTVAAPVSNTMTTFYADLGDESEHKNIRIVVDTPPTTGGTGVGHEECAFCGKKFDENVVVPATGEASVDGVIYATLTEALAAAEANDVILLNKDAAAESISLKPNVTLDLGGNTLTADYFVGFKGSALIDGSADNSGKLMIEKDNAALDRTNAGFLPVYEDGGYIFTTVKLENRAKFTDPTTFVFSPVFETFAHEALMAGKENSGVKIVIRLEWEDEDNYAATQDFAYLDARVGKVIGSYDAAKSNYALAFSAAFAGSEAGQAENVKVSAVVLSETGVEIASSAFTFEG